MIGIMSWNGARVVYCRWPPWKKRASDEIYGNEVWDRRLSRHVFKVDNAFSQDQVGYENVLCFFVVKQSDERMEYFPE